MGGINHNILHMGNPAAVVDEFVFEEEGCTADNCTFEGFNNIQVVILFEGDKEPYEILDSQGIGFTGEMSPVARSSCVGVKREPLDVCPTESLINIKGVWRGLHTGLLRSRRDSAFTTIVKIYLALARCSIQRIDHP